MKNYSLVTEYIENGDTITLWRSDKDPKKVVKIKNKKIPKKFEFVNAKEDVGRRQRGSNIK